ncbi:hypothetical protein LINPERHAP1_LOCUS8523 [Linum perenne]
MRAELRAAEIGLDTAWNMGLRNVILQLDSVPGASAIEGHPSKDTRHSSITQHIQTLQNRS